MRHFPIALAALALLGCSDRERPTAAQARDPQPPRRSIEAPTGTVRPLPPYAIRSDGVGPYVLDEKITSLMQQLPSGPRIASFEIPGVVGTNVIRAEDDSVLIGGETEGTAKFIAVVGPEVARTESNVHVGSTREELVRTLGPLVDDPLRARDPRLAVAGKLPNALVVLDDARIAAIVVQSPEPAAAAGAQSGAECRRPTSTASAFGICLSSAGELVEVDGDELVIRSIEPERAGEGSARPRERSYVQRVPDLVFAAPLRNAAEGRDELVAIARTDDPQQRSWSITAYRLESGRLVRAVDPTVIYRLSGTQSRWIGADLRDVDLYLELTSRAEGIEIGGLLVTRNHDKVRDVVVISTALANRRHGRPPPPPEPPDSGLGGHATPPVTHAPAPDARAPLPDGPAVGSDEP
ncbi:MAG: hypothetical protein ACTHU0_27015 [Kofleriaceae bacterium]